MIECKYCHQEPVLLDGDYYNHENQIVIATGPWTVLCIGVDKDGNTVMRACCDDYTDDYYPKYCPECGRKLRKEQT